MDFDCERIWSAADCSRVATLADMWNQFKLIPARFVGLCVNHSLASETENYFLFYFVRSGKMEKKVQSYYIIIIQVSLLSKKRKERKADKLRVESRRGILCSLFSALHSPFHFLPGGEKWPTETGKSFRAARPGPGRAKLVRLSTSEEPLTASSWAIVEKFPSNFADLSVPASQPAKDNVNVWGCIGNLDRNYYYFHLWFGCPNQAEFRRQTNSLAGTLKPWKLATIFKVETLFSSFLLSSLLPSPYLLLPLLFHFHFLVFTIRHSLFALRSAPLQISANLASDWRNLKSRFALLSRFQSQSYATFNSQQLSVWEKKTLLQQQQQWEHFQIMTLPPIPIDLPQFDLSSSDATFVV